MTRIVLWLLAFTCCAAHAATKVEKPGRPSLSPNRYLFVVDTSAAMSVYDQKLRQHFFDLLFTGLNEQLNTNDSFGVWTFDQKVDTRYPMQVWEPRRKLELASRATQFLKSHRYENESRLDVAMQNIADIIKGAQDVTVFLMNDGQDTLAGTPFDEEINQIYKQNYKELRKIKVHFVTTLVAREGRIVAWSVVRGGEPLTLPLPPLPFEPPPPAATNAPDVAASSATNAPVVKPAVASIIITKDTLPFGPLPPSAQPVGTIAVNAATNVSVTAVPVRESTNAVVAPTNTASASVAQVTFSPTNHPGSEEKPAISAARKPLPLPSFVPAQMTVAARGRDSATGGVTRFSGDAAPLTAVAVPAGSFGNSRLLFIMGLGLFTVAAGLIFVVLRRTRLARQPSAITASMQNLRK